MDKTSVTVTLEGLTERQKAICELLWKCNTLAEIDYLIKVGGVEFQAMTDLIMAERLDQITEVENEVKEYLTKF